MLFDNINDFDVKWLADGSLQIGNITYKVLVAERGPCPKNPFGGYQHTHQAFTFKCIWCEKNPGPIELAALVGSTYYPDGRSPFK